MYEMRADSTTKEWGVIAKERVRQRFLCVVVDTMITASYNAFE
jgi:hypothetical protein